MKSNLIIGAIILILVSGLGCKKDNPASLTNTPDNYMVGSWRISSFVDGNVNQTTHFSEYTFICDASGNMSICINGDTIYSNWQWGDDSHSMCNFDIMGCDNDSYLLIVSIILSFKRMLNDVIILHGFITIICRLPGK